MPKAILILCLILYLWPAKVYCQENRNNDKLRDVIRDFGQADITVPYINRKEADYLSSHLSVYSVKDKQLYISLSPSTLDWFISQKIDYQIIENSDIKGIVTAVSIRQAMEWDTYPTYSQYDSIMKKFTSLYPSLCRLDTIGRSINNRLVLALKISDNASSNEDEPEVFYTSSMHGDETGGFVLMLRLIDYLLKNYNTSPTIRDLVDNLEIWINPLANPDGTYRSGNAIISPLRVNASGDDLNRSFPDPGDPSIVVPKENVDMIKFMRKHRFVISANFHGGSEVVNYPWDRWYTRYHADDEWFLGISGAYADTVHIYSGTGYMTDESNGVTRGADWYTIKGGRHDFTTWELQGREVTIELDRIKTTPAAQLGLLWLYNRNSLLGYLENALYGIHGLVRDSATFNPVHAKVFISGHDKDSSHVYSDTLTGSFTRFLAPGLYNLTFSSSGYKEKTIYNVDVSNRVRADLTVDLQAESKFIDIPLPGPPTLYPNPASYVINAMLPKEVNGNVVVKIASNSGKIVSQYKIFSQAYVPVMVDVKRFPAGSYSIVFKNNTTGKTSEGRFVVVK